MPHRVQSLQSTRAAHDAFYSGRDRLLQFLSHIPSYEPQETDGLGQMETKLNNQKVRRPLPRSQEDGHKEGQRLASPFMDGGLAAVLARRAPSTRVSDNKDGVSLTSPSSVPSTGPGPEWTLCASQLNKQIATGTQGSPRGKTHFQSPECWLPRRQQGLGVKDEEQEAQQPGLKSCSHPH